MRKWQAVLVIVVFAVGCASTGGGVGTVEAQGAGLPPGFELSEFATGIQTPRFLAFGPDTGAGPNFEVPPPALYVTAIRAGQVVALPDRDADGKADETIVFAEDLSIPHGIAWHEGWLYVGETHQVVRLRDTTGDLRADEREVVAPGLPPRGQHFTRTIGFSPGGELFVAAGSSCNVCVEGDKLRAAISRWNPDAKQWEDYASGLRNSVGFTWHPGTGELWSTDNGRDMLGDDYPPDELNLIVEGGDYGWPFCHGNNIPDPELGAPERCRETIPPAFPIQAHSAALGLEFYTGEMFPEEYRGDLFIAFHGSWNRSVPTGYKVVRVRFEENRPAGIEDFVDVWYGAGDRRRVRHRPVDVKTGPDGALYISDDRGGAIFRLTYTGN